MTGAIKVNGKRQSAKIGGVTVFTYEGAREAYFRFAKLAQDWEKYGVAGFNALSKEALKMVKIGFDPEEVEQIEIEAIV